MLNSKVAENNFASFLHLMLLLDLTQEWFKSVTLNFVEYLSHTYSSPYFHENYNSLEQFQTFSFKLAENLVIKININFVEFLLTSQFIKQSFKSVVKQTLRYFGESSFAHESLFSLKN